MAEVITRGAINQFVEECIYDNKQKEFRCYSPANPHYYKNEAGIFQPINNTAVTLTTSKSDVSMLLADQNVYSVGFRTDNNLEKCIGIRPSEKQDGSEQFEISIESIEFDGKEHVYDAQNVRVLSPTLIGNDTIAVQTTRQRMRQLVKVSGALRTFAIVYRLHVKGLTITEIDGEYHFHNEQKQFRFKIGKPYLVDTERLEPISIQNNPFAAKESERELEIFELPEYVTHSLVVNKDGTYTYVKESTKEFYDANIIGNYYIDVDIVYSSTADGYVYNRYYSVLGAGWSTFRNATSGYSVSTSDASLNVATRCGYELSGAYYFMINRAYFYFDVSSLSGIPTEGTVNIYGYSTSSGQVTLQKGTQENTLTVSDYDSFSGSYYSYKNPWSTSGYNSFNLNTAGLSDLAEVLGSGMFKVCAREKGHDYDNSAPGVGTTYRGGMYFADQSGTTYDPYLSIEFEVAGGQPFRKRWGGVNFSAAKVHKGVW